MDKLFLAAWLFIGSLFIGLNHHNTNQQTVGVVPPTPRLTTLPSHTIPLQTQTAASNGSITFTIRGGNRNDTYDASGKAILKPHKQQGYNFITLDASYGGGTAELPVGALIFLRYPMGLHKVVINPVKGVVEYPGAVYYLPLGVDGIYKVVGEGTATLTVTKFN
jgi:hypothetical protein